MAPAAMIPAPDRPSTATDASAKGALEFAKTSAGNNKMTPIDEIIHTTTFIMSEGESNSNNSSDKSTYRGKINFNADHPFCYYVKYTPTNTIILNGVFY